MCGSRLGAPQCVHAVRILNEKTRSRENSFAAQGGGEIRAIGSWRASVSRGGRRIDRTQAGDNYKLKQRKSGIAFCHEDVGVGTRVSIDNRARAAAKISKARRTWRDINQPRRYTFQQQAHAAIRVHTLGFSMSAAYILTRTRSSTFHWLINYSRGDYASRKRDFVSRQIGDVRSRRKTTSEVSLFAQHPRGGLVRSMVSYVKGTMTRFATTIRGRALRD